MEGVLLQQGSDGAAAAIKVKAKGPSQVDLVGRGHRREVRMPKRAGVERSSRGKGHAIPPQQGRKVLRGLLKQPECGVASETLKSWTVPKEVLEVLLCRSAPGAESTKPAAY